MGGYDASITWRRSMTAKVVATLLLGMILLTGCAAASSGPARHLTESEAQLMAVARFKNYNAGTLEISATIHDGGDVWTVKGWFDYAHDVGYASLTNTRGSTTAPASALLIWSQHLLFSTSADGLPGSTRPPLPAPGLDQVAQGWSSTQYQPTAHPSHAALLIIASLGFDRPENPLLLQQSDALWIREDHIGKTRVDVFSGPSSSGVGTEAPSPKATISPDASTVRYWLSDAGVMLRVEMRLGGGEWSSVDLHPLSGGAEPRLPLLDALTSTGH